MQKKWPSYFLQKRCLVADSSHEQTHVDAHDTQTAPAHTPRWASTPDPTSCTPKPSCGRETHDTHLGEVREGECAAGASATRCPQKTTTVPLEHHCPFARQHWAERTETSSNSSLKIHSDLFPQPLELRLPNGHTGGYETRCHFGNQASASCRLPVPAEPQADPLGAARPFNATDVRRSPRHPDICSPIKPTMMTTIADLYL